MLTWLRTWLSRWRSVRTPETSRLIVGSTGSGKSEGELVDLVRLADQRDRAVILLDGHGPLAFAAAGHWAARGHEERLVYEPLNATQYVLSWNMLPRSAALSLSDRRIEDAETREEVIQCFLAQRNLSTVNDRAWTKEWMDAAIALCLSQPASEPLPSLLHAFRVGSPDYERLLNHSREPEIVAKFRDMEQFRRRSPVQYELQTGPARRLLELVCTSEVVRLRSRPGPFDWLAALREKKLIAVDGGGIRSREIKRTLCLLMSMQVLHAVRRHFAETQQPLPVVLVLEEAGALDLVTPFILDALQELRKAGLAIHLITQSSLDFDDPRLFQAMLSHTPWQAWYQLLSPADQELGAKALANATFDPLTVHYTRTRLLADGVRPVATQSTGEAVDTRSGSSRQDRRTGTAFLAQHKEIAEAYYKTPQLWEQEFRTKLATLRIGERFVRDRSGVRRERVTPVRPSRLPVPFDVFTRTVIDRVRRQAIYQPCQIPVSPDAIEALPDAALRLRQRSETASTGHTAKAADSHPGE